MAAFDADLGPFRAGDRFLKYEIRGLLGRGGYAFVYQGYDPFLDRESAIKVIVRPADPKRDLRRRAQFEARILSRLRHPNVVEIFDAGATDEGFVYIVMELLRGRSLREVFREYKPLTVPEALQIGVHIADGVHVAHAEQAIHRDLKPENVFLLPDNVAKVLDFGIAKFLDHGSLTTQKDHIHGTMLYMSPEHLQGKAVTPRSDVYALGTILYEAMAGRPPTLLGMTEITMNAVAWAQINRMPPPLNELNDTVPSHVARIVQRMIAKDPADRFASMQEASAALRSAAERLASEGGASGMRKLWERTEHVTKANALVNPHTAITKEALPSGEQPTTRIASDELDRTASPEQATRAFEPAELLARALGPRSSTTSTDESVSSAGGMPSPHTVSGVSTAVHVPTLTDHGRRHSGRAQVWSVVGVAAALGIAGGVVVGLSSFSPRAAHPESSAAAGTESHLAPAPLAAPSASTVSVRRDLTDAGIAKQPTTAMPASEPSHKSAPAPSVHP